MRTAAPEMRRTNIGYIVDANIWKGEEGTYPAFNYQQLVELHHCNAKVKFLFTPYMGLNEEATACLRMHPEVVIIAQSNHPNRLGEFRGIAQSTDESRFNQSIGILPILSGKQYRRFADQIGSRYGSIDI